MNIKINYTIKITFVFTIIATILFIYIHPYNCDSDTWTIPIEKDYKSISDKYIVKITPDPDIYQNLGACKISLFFNNGNERKIVWSRYLINNYAPVDVFVSDTGKRVVTINEWFHIGELPIVIYGDKGRLIKVHSIASLGLDNDQGQIKSTVSSYMWNEDSIAFFGPEDEYFFIRLHWGKWITIELQNGKLFKKDMYFFRQDLESEHLKICEKLKSYRERKLKELVFAMFGSSNPEERKIAAVVSGQEKYQDAIPKLQQLLNDRKFYIIDGGKKIKKYYIREAAKEALASMKKKN
jgi:hypothetical protein